MNADRLINTALRRVSVATWFATRAHEPSRIMFWMLKYTEAVENACLQGASLEQTETAWQYGYELATRGGKNRVL